MSLLLLQLKSYRIARFLFFLAQLIQCVVNDLDITLICTALGFRSTEASITAPCSVKA